MYFIRILTGFFFVINDVKIKFHSIWEFLKAVSLVQLYSKFKSVARVLPKLYSGLNKLGINFIPPTH